MIKTRVLEFESTHGRSTQVRRFVNFANGLLRGGTTPPRQKRTRLSSTPQGTPNSSPQQQQQNLCDVLESLHTDEYDEYNEYRLQNNVWKLPNNLAHTFNIPDLVSDFFIVKSIPSVGKPTKRKSTVFHPLSETIATNAFALALPGVGPCVYAQKKCTDGNTSWSNWIKMRLYIKELILCFPRWFHVKNRFWI